MEQWNNSKQLNEISNSKECSMEDFLKERYLDNIVQKKGLEKEELKGETVAKKIELAEAAESRRKGLPKIADYANYGKYQKAILFKILDMILIDSRPLLYKKNSKRYVFTRENCFFMNILLDLYEERNPEILNLLDGWVNRLDSGFIDFLYEGLCELAENENTVLQKEDLQLKWNLIFCPAYKEVCELMEELRASVLYYVGAISGKQVNNELFNELKEKLQLCNDEIVNITKERVEFPDIDFDELDAQQEKRRLDKKRRSENAKNAWKNRRKNEGGKK